MWECVGPNRTCDVDSWVNEAGLIDGQVRRASAMDGWSGDDYGVDG